MAGPARHAHCLLKICEEANLVEEIFEESKQHIQLLRLGQHNVPVVSVEVRLQILHRLTNYVFACLHRSYYHHLVSDDGFHENVEDYGGQRVSLGHPMLSLERRYIVTPGFFHHLEPDLVCPKETERPGAHAISIQNFEKPVPAYVVLRVLEVQ